MASCSEEENLPCDDAPLNEAYHAQVGFNVAKRDLQRLQASMTSDARGQFRLGNYDRSLQLFNQALAIANKTGCDLGARGVLLNNIGSCLHHLGDFGTAREHYVQALQATERAAETRSTRAGDSVLSQRARFLRKRLREVDAGVTPDSGTYLDGAGRMVSEEGDEVPAMPYFEGEDEPGVERMDASVDEATQEAARREWLEYYLRTSQWDKAADLVVTEGEYDDLVYLVDRQRREAREAGKAWEAGWPFGMDGLQGGASTYRRFLEARGVLSRGSP